MITYIPNSFAFQIRKLTDSPIETRGYWTKTDFGRTNIFKIYIILIYLFKGILPLVMLISFNLKSLLRFKTLLETIEGGNNQCNVSMISFREDQNQDGHMVAIKKLNTRFTRMVISLTFICILTRFFDVAVGSFFVQKIVFSVDFINVFLEQLLLALNVFVLITAHALDGLLYYYYDENMKGLLIISVRSKLAALIMLIFIIIFFQLLFFSNYHKA